MRAEYTVFSENDCLLLYVAFFLCYCTCEEKYFFFVFCVMSPLILFELSSESFICCCHSILVGLLQNCSVSSDSALYSTTLFCNNVSLIETLRFIFLALSIIHVLGFSHLYSRGLMIRICHSYSALTGCNSMMMVCIADW